MLVSLTSDPTTVGSANTVAWSVVDDGLTLRRHAARHHLFTALCLLVVVLVFPKNAASQADDTKITFESFDPTSGRHSIFTVNPDGSEQRRVSDRSLNAKSPAWSPDSSQIAFESNGDIYVMNADGAHLKQLTRGPTSERSPAWSYDGSRIVFDSTRSSNTDLYAVNADGSNQQRLTNDPAPDHSATWSRNGRQIAFVSNRSGTPNIYVMRPDGAKVVRLTSSPFGDEQPAWSPNGRRIAFVSYRTGHAQIHVMDADGSRQRQLMEHVPDDYYPAWSPTGKEIVFASVGEGTGGLYVTDTEGSHSRHLASTRTNASHPSWSPSLPLTPPTVMITTPSHSPSTTTTSRISLRAVATRRAASAITWTKVLVNGQPLPGSRGQKTLQVGISAPKEVFIEETVPLHLGRNEITVTAGTASTESNKAIVVVSYEPRQVQQPPTAGPKPDLYVLAIGIAEYSDPGLNLRYPDDDARDFVDACEKQEGRFYGKVDARTLTDQEATRANIIEGLDWLRRSTTMSDVAFFFASAHGVKDAMGDAYLFSYDANPENVLASAVPWTEFRRFLGRIPSRVVMFMDTCFSGGFADGRLNKGVANFSSTYQLLAQEGLVIWASSTGEEQSIERDEWENGAFTEALVQGMTGVEADVDKDGVLTELELSTFVSRRVRDLTGGSQHFFVDKPPGSDFPMFGVIAP